MCPVFVRRTFLALCLLGTALPISARAEEPVQPTISLTVDYGDGVSKSFAKIPWKEKQTVWDVLQAAVKHPRGIKLMHRGSGATTLVTQIDDLANEGRGKNWLFEVNGKLGEKSCAVVELAAGDAVLWRFAEYQ
jgi:hypothetical protein